MKTVIFIYRWIAALLTMLVTGSIGLVLVIISFGTLRNFLNRHYLNYVSRFILLIIGCNYRIPPVEDFPKHPVFYTFNHNSYLDIFLLTGIGLTNIRYLLSEKTLKYVPLILSAKAVGTHYVPQQMYPKRRLRFFIRATEFLQRNRHLSMAGAAEGVHDHRNALASFNRGIFHMAMEAKRNIVPLFLHIPKESNPDDFKDAKGSTLAVEILPEIDTSNWTLDNLESHIDDVRQIFVKRFNELNPNDKTE